MRKDDRVNNSGKYIVRRYYTTRDFPRHRAYIILGRVIKTGEIYGYSNGKFDKNTVSVFKSFPKYNKDAEFSKRELASCRKELAGNVDRAVQRAKSNLKYPERVDVFKVRIGSKKCPVKVDMTPFITNKTSRVPFVMKEK